MADLFGKLLKTGAAYLEHSRWIESVITSDGAQMHRLVESYVGKLSQTSYLGLTVMLTAAVKAEKNPQRAAKLQDLMERAGKIRKGDAAPSAQPAAPHQAAPRQAAPKPAPARDFDADLELVGGWYDLPSEQQAPALAQTLSGLDAAGAQLLLENVRRMISNTNRRIEEHNENEGKAWGGYVEDQMAYAMARLRTGQRDPEWVRRYQMLQSVKEFFERVANAIAADIEAKKKPPIPAPSPTPDPQDASNATIEALKRMADDLKTRVQKGEISAARAAEYTQLLHNLKDFGARGMEQLDRAAILEKARGLFSRFEQNYADPSGSGRIPEQARLAGADRIDRYVQEMKRFLLREAQNLPPEHTLRETTTLMGELSQMQQTLAAAQTEADVLSLEREQLRAAARRVHQFSLKRHLTLAKPLWECPEPASATGQIFFSGDKSLEQMLEKICRERGLHLLKLGQAQDYGQKRWDLLRSAQVGVFDLRDYVPKTRSAEMAGIAYELGLALALGIPAVVVTTPNQVLPFDLTMTTCEIRGKSKADIEALKESVDAALYGITVSTDDSSLEASLAFFQREMAEHPKRAVFEKSGWLSDELNRDPVAMAGALRQMIRQTSGRQWEILYPCWPGDYPAPGKKQCFHVMPFSEAWSDSVRDAARGVCKARGYEYRRGDEAEEGRVIRAIWDDLCRAHLVLTDLTGLNLNVLIELGMAHALGRETLLAAHIDNQGEKLPRNIQKLRVLYYEDPAEIDDWMVRRRAVTS